jgi:hypothetical protein
MNTNLTFIEIESLSRAIATVDLELQGFVWKQNKSIPGLSEFEATRGSEGRLIQVRTTVHPQESLGLSQDEVDRFKLKASQIGCEPWLAQIFLRADGSVAKAISWTKLE